MKDESKVDVIVRFGVEHDMREASERPCAWVRHAQFYDVVCRLALRVPGDLPAGMSRSLEDVQDELRVCLAEPAINGLIDAALARSRGTTGLGIVAACQPSGYCTSDGATSSLHRICRCRERRGGSASNRSCARLRPSTVRGCPICHFRPGRSE